MLTLHNLSKRQINFIFGCILSRATIVVLASRYPREMAVPTLIAAIGFFIIYILGLRKTGIETNGEPIWWDWLRPVHAALFAGFAFVAYSQDNLRYKAWVLLAIDLFIGVIAWSKHHKFLT